MLKNWSIRTTLTLVGLLFVGSALTFWMRPNKPFIDPRESAVTDKAVSLGESASSVLGAL